MGQNDMVVPDHVVKQHARLGKYLQSWLALATSNRRSIVTQHMIESSVFRKEALESQWPQLKLLEKQLNEGW